MNPFNSFTFWQEWHKIFALLFTKLTIWDVIQRRVHSVWCETNTQTPILDYDHILDNIDLSVTDCDNCFVTLCSTIRLGCVVNYCILIKILCIDLGLRA